MNRASVDIAIKDSVARDVFVEALNSVIDGGVPVEQAFAEAKQRVLNSILSLN